MCEFDERAIDLPNSVLPMRVADEEGHVVETTVCSAISGGQDEVHGMPRTVTLLRTRGSSTVSAKYLYAHSTHAKELPVIYTVKAGHTVLYEGSDDIRARSVYDQYKEILMKGNTLTFECKILVDAVEG